MAFPDCFVLKCSECEWRAVCAKAIWQGKPPIQPVVKPVVQPKERHRRRTGKKIKDMTHEEKKAYWREHAAKKRESSKKRLGPAAEVSGAELERIQKLQNKIDKVKERQNNLVPERP